jgi:hypothetical protein
MALNYICIDNFWLYESIRWLAILMGIVILGITGFQAYWLRDNYSREKNAVEVRMDALFQETVRRVQDSLLVQRWTQLF